MRLGQPIIIICRMCTNMEWIVCHTTYLLPSKSLLIMELVTATGIRTQAKCLWAWFLEVLSVSRRQSLQQFNLKRQIQKVSPLSLFQIVKPTSNILVPSLASWCCIPDHAVSQVLVYSCWCLDFCSIPSLFSKQLAASSKRRWDDPGGAPPEEPGLSILFSFLIC